MWWHLDETDTDVRRQTVQELLPKITPLFRPHKRLLFIAFGLLLFISASQWAGPIVVRYIIDTSIPAADITGLAVAAGVYVLITALGTAVGYLQAITLFRLGINIITDLKARLFKHVLYLGLEFHEEQSPGKLISRVESDTETLKELFSDVTVNMLRNMIYFLGILVILCVTEWSVAAWVMLLVPLLFTATFWFIGFMRKYWREWRVQWATLTSYVTEYVQGIDVIQQFNYQERAKERMFETSMGKYRVEVPASYLDYGFWGAFMYGEILAIIIVLIVGVQGVFAGIVTIGTLVMFFLYISQMFQPIMALSEQLNFIQRSLISVERVFGILETEPKVTDGSSPEGMLSFNQEITFENVWFAYKRMSSDDDSAGNLDTASNDGCADCDQREWEWVLRDVSFSIPCGHRIALVGASGGGKSTLVNLLLRFYDPQRGRILVDGKDIRSFPVAAWRSMSGLVLQDVFLFPGSVSENLRVFDNSITRERVTQAARTTRADRVIDKLPDGYEGKLSERGANLSVGERQLLSFARALAQDPMLLVLDEATSSVDPHTEQLVQEAMEKLLENRTAVIVAHRLSTILGADRIMLIHDGGIAESGTHDELLAKDGLYAKLFRLQFDGVGGGAE